MYYKGCDGKTDRERELLKGEFERLKLVEKERKNNGKLALSDFCNRSAFKGIATSIAMAWFMQITGSFVITNYASLIFEKSGSILDAHYSAIVLASVQIIGGLVSSVMGDTFGRKTTLYISLFGSAAGMLTFSIYLYLRENAYDVSKYLWMPELTMAFTIFISSAGVVALANICAIENFPTKVSIHRSKYNDQTKNRLQHTISNFYITLIEICSLDLLV